MDLPPNHDGLNIADLYKWVAGITGGVVAFWKWVDGEFKKKKLEAETLKLEREHFIKTVATEAVKQAMDSILSEVKDDVKTLFKYREDDRRHIDNKFDNIMKELKK